MVALLAGLKKNFSFVHQAPTRSLKMNLIGH